MASSSLPKWQLALVVGAPVAIGLSYMYYRNRSDSGSKISPTRDGALADKALSIDDHATNKSTKIQPHTAEQYKNEGNKQFKLGNFKEAIVQYEKAVEICSKNRIKDMAIFYQNKAAAYEQLKMYEAVREDCTKALELDPRYVKALLRRARALEKLGEFEPALDDVSTACILEGFSNTTSLTLADRILEQLGKEHAEEDMKHRKFIMPSKHFIRSYIESFSKDPVFSRIKHTDAEDTPEFFKKPLQALRGEKYETISSICADIINSAEFPSLPPSRMEIVLLQATFEVFHGQHDNALKLFKSVLNSEDSSLDVKLNALIKRGTLQMQLDDPIQAFIDFDEAIMVDKTSPDIYHHRGQLYLLANNLEKAKIDFDTAIACDPNFPSPVVKKYYTEYRLAIKENDVVQVTRILTDFQSCLEQFPNFAECDLLYAQIWRDIENYEKSEEYFTKALEKDPDNATIHVHKGLLQLQWNSGLDKTIEYIKKAINMDPKCELAYETLGSIEVQRGNLEEAIRLFDEALRLAHTFRQLTHLYSLKDAAKTQLVIKKRLGDL